MGEEFNILLEKLNAFIRKYYINKLIKGALLTLTVVLFLFLFVDFIEYFAWMGSAARRFVFFTFLAVIIFLIVSQILLPVLKLFRIGKILSYEESAKIIGRFFPEVNDKLVNVLQLKFSEENFSKKEIELLLASINQKSLQLKPIPFTKAVDFKKNLKYLKYFLPPFFIILIILIVYPSFIIEPSKRIVDYEKHFTKPLPYSITLLNKSLKVIQHDNYTVKIKIDGDEIPNEIFINTNGLKYRMYPAKKGYYEYQFKDVNKDIVFNFSTEDYVSDNYLLKVLPKPVIYSFDINLHYPGYLNKKDDKISGIGDLVIPEGTEIEWRIHTRDVSDVLFFIDDSLTHAKKIKENTFLKKFTANKNFRYGLSSLNPLVNSPDTMFYSVRVVKDEYPSISVEEYSPDKLSGFIQFSGKIKDDYGFHSLKFFYKKFDDSNWKVKNLNIDKTVNEEYFEYPVQLLELGVDLGKGLNYYFEVRDNDALHGYKASRSIRGFLHLPSEDELESLKDSTSDAIKDEMKNKIKELENLNKKIEELKLDMLQKRKMNWSDKKKIEDLIQKEKQIQDKLDKLNKLNDEIKNLEETLKEKQNPQLQKELDELKEMFEKLKDENLQKELDKLKKELNKMDKEKLNEFLDKMKNKNENLKEDLEQNLELYKQLEVEKKMDETINKLKELSEKQKELSEKTKSKKIDGKEALEEQKKINKDFKELQKQIDEVKKLDEELKDPFGIKKDKEAIKDIKNEMNEAEDKLEKGKEKKASENQKNASEKMKQMADDMENLFSMAMMKRVGEDMDKIRRLLDNLVDLSFRQESLIKEIEKISEKDPKFVTSTEELSNLKDEFKIIKDSLKAIGNRQVAIKPFIIKETTSIETNLEAAIKNMADRKKGSSLVKQQYAMTHINNLALMLDESLDQMKNSLSSSGKGGMSCPNPGSGKSKSLDDIMKGQKKLQKGMQKGMNKGKQKGNKNKGGQSNGEWGDSEQLAKMAAMQYQLRMELQKLIEQMKGEGTGDKNLNKALEEMKKNEEDIINRKITIETINRQKDITVRLLKAKNAKMQREKEKRRESEEGMNNKKRTIENKQVEIDKINKKDIIFTKPVELNYYFNSVYKKYIYKLELEGKED